MSKIDNVSILAGVCIRPNAIVFGTNGSRPYPASLADVRWNAVRILNGECWSCKEVGIDGRLVGDGLTLLTQTDSFVVDSQPIEVEGAFR